MNRVMKYYKNQKCNKWLVVVDENDDIVKSYYDGHKDHAEEIIGLNRTHTDWDGVYLGTGLNKWVEITEDEFMGEMLTLAL